MQVATDNLRRDGVTVARGEIIRKGPTVHYGTGVKGVILILAMRNGDAYRSLWLWLMFPPCCAAWIFAASDMKPRAWSACAWASSA